MSEEWGPWQEHDGKGCPVPTGTFAHVVDLDKQGNYGEHFVFIKAGHLAVSSWTMRDVLGPYTMVIRYRIRRPRGMTLLEGLLENLPATVEGVDA